MNINVNGEPTSYDGPANVEDLLTHLELPAGRVAVMLNDEVVTRDNRKTTPLKQDDRLEVLTFAGGG